MGLIRNQVYGLPYRGFESHPLRQKNKRPHPGPFIFLAERGLGFRILFEPGSSEAASGGAKRPSHSLRNRQFFPVYT